MNTAPLTGPLKSFTISNNKAISGTLASLAVFPMVTPAVLSRMSKRLLRTLQTTFKRSRD